MMRKPACGQLLGQHLGVGHDLPRVLGELRLQRLAQRHRLGRDDVHQRPALLPGKDAAVDGCRQFLTAQNHAERGPRRVLCVVVVTTCACGTGEGCTPPATSPAKCAMSIISDAPTLSAIARIRTKSNCRG